MPTTDQNDELNPVRSVPGQDWSCSSVGGVVAAILSERPPQPPTLFRASIVSGSSAATMTKNCSTSL